MSIEEVLERQKRLLAEAEAINQLPEVQEWKRQRHEDRIASLMIVNKVWCRNGSYASNATPCRRVCCPYKNFDMRLATAKELSKCRTFAITTNESDWANAKHIKMMEEKYV